MELAAVVVILRVLRAGRVVEDKVSIQHVIVIIATVLLVEVMAVN
jgi:hypothetical protein